eukprot:1605081-Prymnesium_polylepis.1
MALGSLADVQEEGAKVEAAMEVEVAAEAAMVGECTAETEATEGLKEGQAVPEETETAPEEAEGKAWVGGETVKVREVAERAMVAV